MIEKITVLYSTSENIKSQYILSLSPLLLRTPSRKFNIKIFIKFDFECVYWDTNITFYFSLCKTLRRTTIINVQINLYTQTIILKGEQIQDFRRILTVYMSHACIHNCIYWVFKCATILLILILHYIFGGPGDTCIFK
jgi:hypothetical protein